ncbi:unnamed protein product [Laminaria digitata]
MSRGKQALRERVENVRSSSQVAQAQPREQHVEESYTVEQVKKKSICLQKTLRSVNNNGSVRIDELTGEASLIDVVTMLCPEKTSDHVKTTLGRVIAKDSDQSGVAHNVPIAERVHYVKINGKGLETPVRTSRPSSRLSGCSHRVRPRNSGVSPSRLSVACLAATCRCATRSSSCMPACRARRKAGPTSHS